MLSKFGPLKRLSERAVHSNSLSGLDPVQISYMNENCIAVNENDRILGDTTKVEAHSLNTMKLHRAFSVFAFTPDRKLILQKRSPTKITFPDMWTNTCCSHPLFRDDERNGIDGAKRAASRKMLHELGVPHICPQEFVYKGKYLYQAKMTDSPWVEHEMDYALILRNLSTERINPNPEEVSDVVALSREELYQKMNDNQLRFTPWFNLFFKLNLLQEWWTKLDTINDDIDHIVRMN